MGQGRLESHQNIYNVLAEQVRFQTFVFTLSFGAQKLSEKPSMVFGMSDKHIVSLITGYHRRQRQNETRNDYYLAEETGEVVTWA